MNETFQEDLQNRVTSYLDAIESSATNAGEFVLEQTPLVAQEYLLWEFWKNVIQGGIFGFIVAFAAIAGAKVTYIIWNSEKEEVLENGFPPFCVFPAFATLFICLPLGSIFVVRILRVLEVIIAPRLVLLEKIQELLS